jgi:glutamate racemase
VGREVVLVSSADETAFEVRAWLEGVDGPTARGPAAGPARHTFLSSGDVDWFRRLGSRLLGPEVTSVQAAPWC